MRLALAKSGVDLSFMSSKKSDAFLEGHSVLFEDLEHGLISHLDQIEKTAPKIKSKDTFLKSSRSNSGSPSRTFKCSFKATSTKAKSKFSSRSTTPVGSSPKKTPSLSPVRQKREQNIINVKEVKEIHVLNPLNKEAMDRISEEIKSQVAEDMIKVSDELTA